MLKRHFLKTLACTPALLTGASALAQAFPSKPIRIIVPFNPGGALDALARKLAPGLGTRLGQSVIVENKAGGNTIIATQYVAGAVPDGQTLYLTLSAPYSLLPHLYKRALPYDPARDYTPVGVATEIMYGLVVNAALNINSVTEYVEYAKKNPGKLSYGSSGPGQALSLSMELLKSQLGIETLHVPFNGSAPVMQALAAGQVDSALMDIGLAQPFVKAGKVKVLAIVSKRRSPAVPDVPTMAEAGVNLDIPPLWIGVVGPRGMAASTVARLNEAIGNELRSPQLAGLLDTLSLAPMPTTPAEMDARIKAESAVWSTAVTKLGIQLD